MAGKNHRVVDFQRGTVQKVSSTAITVKSSDGFTATYTVTPETKIRKEKAPGKITDVVVNDRVRLLAVKNGNTVTAKVIGDHGTR